MRCTRTAAQGPGALALAALLLVAVLLAGCSGASPDEPPSWVPGERVSTPRGDLTGRVDGEVLRFQGVPYAEPPTGERRFAPPEPVASWEGDLDATTQGARCPQPDPAGGVNGDEDCLHLDLTVPNTPSETPRAVMVWLHGGGFTEGSGTDYDPRQLATEGDVIVVTLDYRLGALGFLATPDMPGGGSFGLLDQQEALRFVQDVAPSFGGDPDNVTVFGESAGATSLCYQLLAPETAGLIDRAIVQSAVECGAAAPPNAYALPETDSPDTGQGRPSMRLEDVQERGVQAAAGLGCDDADALDCLRGLPLEEVMALHPRFGWPATGTRVAPTAPWERLDEVAVPVLAGFTRDESRFYPLLGALLGQSYGPGTYEPAIRASFGDRAEAVLQEYPLADYANDAEAWAAVYTDRTFACPQLHANDVMSRDTEVFAYEFADRSAPPPLPPMPGAPEPGAAHTAELPYLFDVAGQPLDQEGNRIPLTGDQERLAARMIDTWTAFARDGEAPVEPWAESGLAVTFGEDGVSTGDPARTHRCDFWALGGGAG